MNGIFRLLALLGLGYLLGRLFAGRPAEIRTPQVRIVHQQGNTSLDTSKLLVSLLVWGFVLWILMSLPQLVTLASLTFRPPLAREVPIRVQERPDFQMSRSVFERIVLEEDAKYLNDPAVEAWCLDIHGRRLVPVVGLARDVIPNGTVTPLILGVLPDNRTTVPLSAGDAPPRCGALKLTDPQ